MKQKAKRTIYGGFIAAMILTFSLGCKLGSTTTDTVDTTSVENTNSEPVDKQSVKAKKRYFWGGWLVQNNKKYPKTQFVFGENKKMLINYDYGNDDLPDDKLEEAEYEYIDRETVKIRLSNGKSMTAKLSSEDNFMTIDNFKGEDLTLKLNTNRMMFAVCKANPKSCGYPFDE